MGKNKKPELEPEPDKIVRKLGENLSIEVTEAEKKYRNRNSPDELSQLKKEQLKCTVCTKSLTDLLKKGNEPYVHMLLNVLMCRDCSTFYGDGYFSVDEDGDDKYCRWCGQGGTLYLCSSCTCAFCKKCIKQNLSREDVKDLESDEWKCLICKPKPLFECRTVCWFLQENYKKSQELDDNEEEEEQPKKKKSRSSSREEDRRGLKRKASDELIEKKSKRHKSADSGKESNTHNNSKDVTTADRKKRRQSTKEVDGVEEEIIKTTSKSEKPSKKRSSKSEKDLTPNTDTTKNSRVIQEIVISDDNDETEVLSKINCRQNNKKDISKSTTPVKIRPKRSVPKKEVKSPETPKRPTKTDQKSKSTSGKKEPQKSNDKIKSPVKRSNRTNKNNFSDQEESEGECKKSDFGSKLVSLYDENSASESERKNNAVKGRTKSTATLKKPKLKVAKRASSTVNIAIGYIDSGINDVLELTVLINNRCEKLCNRTVESQDEVLTVFKKLKQLVGAVHTNLELIEKGLDTKINGWKRVNNIDIKTPEENFEAEPKLLDGSEIKDNSSLNNKTEEEGVVISNKSPNDKKTDVVEKSPIKEKEEKDSKTLINEHEVSKTDKEMEVDDIQVEKEMDQVEDIDKGELNEKKDGIANGSMDIDNESQNNALKSVVNENKIAEQESNENSDTDKCEKEATEKPQNKESLENKYTPEDIIKSDDIDENIDSPCSTGDDAIDTHISNDNSRTSNCDAVNTNFEPCEKKGEQNNENSEKPCDKIENSESERNEDEENKEKEEIGSKEQECTTTEGQDASVMEDVNECILEDDVKSDTSDKNTDQPNSDKLIQINKNGVENSISEIAVDRCIPEEDAKQEEIDDEGKEEQLDQSLLELEKPLEDTNPMTPSKQPIEISDDKIDSIKREDTVTKKKEEMNKDVLIKSEGGITKEKEGKKEIKEQHSSPEPTKLEKKEGVVSHPHSSQDSSKSSGDRDTFRSSGDRDTFRSSRDRDQSKSFGDRNHHRRSGSWGDHNRDRGHNWNRHQPQERWHHYDNRRPSRGGWEWNH